MRALFNTLVLAGCTAVASHSQAQPADEKPSTQKTIVYDWVADTVAPTGGLGLNFGRRAIYPLSATSSLAGRVTLGGALTFAQTSPTIVSTKFSPTGQAVVDYNRSFWKGRIGTTTSLSASQTQVDKAFYGTDSIKGLAAGFAASVRVLDEISTFASVTIPLNGNLPRSATAGVAVFPFVRLSPDLKGVQMSVARNQTTQDYAGQQKMTTTIMGVGYSWKGDTNNTYYLGLAHGDIHVKKENGKTFSGQAWVPTFSVSMALDK